MEIKDIFRRGIFKKTINKKTKNARQVKKKVFFL